MPFSDNPERQCELSKGWVSTAGPLGTHWQTGVIAKDLGDRVGDINKGTGKRQQVGECM